MSVNPIDDEDLYNVISLGGIESPGIVTISGHDRVAKWDVKEAGGQTGGTTTLKGLPPIDFQCSFFLATVEQFENWESFQDLIESTVNGTSPKAMDIFHPDLVRNGIRSVCAAKIGGKKHDGKGGQTVVVTFQEYAPPKSNGSGNPKKSDLNPTVLRPGLNGPQADPDAEAKARLAALTSQYQNTPWG